MNGSEFMYAVVLSSYSIFQFFGSPFLGSLSDVYGRKKLLIISHGGTLLSWVIFATTYFLAKDQFVLGLSISLWVLIFSRILDGITGGNISVANAYISDVTTERERTKAFGLVGATFGFGFIFGPIIGAFSAQSSLSYYGTVIVAFCISLITLFFIIFGLKDSVNKHKKNHIDFKQTVSESFKVLTKIRNYANDKFISTLFKVRFVFAAIFVSYTSVMVLFLKNSLQLDGFKIGIVFGIVGVFLIINQALVVPFLSKRYGDVNLLIVSQLLMVFSFLAFFSFTYLGLLLLFAYIGNLGMSGNIISIRTLLSQKVDDSKQGEVLGIDGGIFSLNSAFMPLISSVLYVSFGSYFFLALSVLGVVSFILLLNNKSLRLS